MLKAVNKKVKGDTPVKVDGDQSDANLRSRVERDEDEDDRDVGDGVVMVMFPMETWMKVQDMAKSRGVTTGEIVGVALEVLAEKMEAGSGS